MRPPPPPAPRPPPYPSSSHSNFFSSLKHVEKRLKLDSTIPSRSQQSSLPPIPSPAPAPASAPPLPLSSSHSDFFSSLKQVDKRLKLDSTTIPATSQQSSLLPISPPPLPPPPADSIYTATQSLGSTIYLYFNQPTTNTTNSSTFENSEPPREFLSNNSLDFPPTPPDPHQSNTFKHPHTTNSDVNTGIDDIDMLMGLLGLSDSGHQEPGRVCLCLNFVGNGGNSGDCHCDDGFYTKIVGAKGPKCGKELERLNGWIKHFLGTSIGNERREPFRLAHLILAKAAFQSHESGEFECFDSPSTVGDYLRIDPPAEVEEDLPNRIYSQRSANLCQTYIMEK